MEGFCRAASAALSAAIDTAGRVLEQALAAVKE